MPRPLFFDTQTVIDTSRLVLREIWPGDADGEQVKSFDDGSPM